MTLLSSPDDGIPCILEPLGDEKTFRRNWAQLIQKIYEVNPLVCPKCHGAIRVISIIEDQEVIKIILNHLGLWLIGSRPRAKAHAPPVREYVAGGSSPAGFPDNTCYGDPHYSWDAYITT